MLLLEEVLLLVVVVVPLVVELLVVGVVVVVVVELDGVVVVAVVVVELDGVVDEVDVVVVEVEQTPPTPASKITAVLPWPLVAKFIKMGAVSQVFPAWTVASI